MWKKCLIAPLTSLPLLETTFAFGLLNKFCFSDKYLVCLGRKKTQNIRLIVVNS